MSWLSPYRWALLLGLVGALALFHGFKLKQADAQGYERAIGEMTAKAAAEAERARQREQQLAKKAQEANDAATKRETKIRADAARTRAERDRLRDELAASKRDLPGASCEAVRERASALTDVFGECAARLEGLAGQADPHASDAVKLLEDWPE